MRGARPLFLVLLAACGSFATADPTRSDGGVDAGAADGSSEARADDAALSDAADGGAPDADANEAAPCLARPAFEDAFNRSSPVQGAWSGVVLQNGGLLALASSAPIAGSHSLRAEIPVGDDVTARLMKSLTPSSCPLNLAFSFRAAGLPTGPQATSSIVSIRFANGDVELQVLADGALAIADDYDPNVSATKTPLGINVTAANTYRIALVLSTAPTSIAWSIAEGGAAAETGTTKIASPYAPPTDVWIGGEDSATTAGFSFLFDDVRID